MYQHPSFLGMFVAAGLGNSKAYKLYMRRYPNGTRAMVQACAWCLSTNKGKCWDVIQLKKSPNCKHRSLSFYWLQCRKFHVNVRKKPSLVRVTEYWRRLISLFMRKEEWGRCCALAQAGIQPDTSQGCNNPSLRGLKCFPHVHMYMYVTDVYIFPQQQM